ncbi:GTP binding domain [Dillenia turbinata]|uniref:GTP binding domain n=1 Tax=Dillenia turbinata TaxID=194707 RepID=A0AAN8Z9M7_9MAGN
MGRLRRKFQSETSSSLRKRILPTPLLTRVLKGSNIVLSKYSTDALVTKAESVKSSVKTEDCPSDGFPEFALVGRSNVGKSSLLNWLVRRKKLALTSKKPGKTQCINHFRINDSWYQWIYLDTDVYMDICRFAAAPQELRTDWDKFTKYYFLNIFLLIDVSIPTKKIDLEYASWLGENQVHIFLVEVVTDEDFCVLRIPMTLIFTKCDKRTEERGPKKMWKISKRVKFFSSQHFPFILCLICQTQGCCAVHLQEGWAV